MTITLEGQPQSTNHCWKHSCNRGYLMSYMTPNGKTLKESYQWQAAQQYKGEPLTSPLAVSIFLYHGTKRKADIDNFSKILLDSLSGIVWEDDSQIVEVHVYKHYDKDRPRVDLIVDEVSIQAEH